jgi:hypothetical protein
MASGRLLSSGAIDAVLALRAAAMFSARLSGDNGAGGTPEPTQTGSSTVLPLAIGWAEEFDDADIAGRDYLVDAVWDTVFRECIAYIGEDPKNITPCTHYDLVSRHLERCCDHAFRISERVHCKVTGEHIEIK